MRPYDSPRVSKHPRVSLIMVKQMSTVMVNGQESPQKIPEKPADEEETKKKEIDPASLGPDGALQYYAKVGDVEAMRKAYQEGGKVNVPDRGPFVTETVEGETPNHAISGDHPLHMAAGGGHMAAVNELINWEADIEAKNRIGSTPLLRAISHEQFDVAKRLLKEGASISATNKIGNTALHCAAFTGSLEGAKLLIEAQALTQINQPNLFGATPLMFAAKSSSTLCKYFLSLRSGKISSVEYKEDKKTPSGSRRGSAEKRRSLKLTPPPTTNSTEIQSIASPSLPETRTIAAPSIAAPSSPIDSLAGVVSALGEMAEQSLNDIELASESTYTTESGRVDDR